MLCSDIYISFLLSRHIWHKQQKPFSKWVNAGEMNYRSDTLYQLTVIIWDCLPALVDLLLVFNNILWNIELISSSPVRFLHSSLFLPKKKKKKEVDWWGEKERKKGRQAGSTVQSIWKPCYSQHFRFVFNEQNKDGVR